MRTFVRLWDAAMMTVFALLIPGVMYRLGQTGDGRGYTFIAICAVGFIAYLHLLLSTFPAVPNDNGGEL